jgi:hypothetical protein
VGRAMPSAQPPPWRLLLSNLVHLASLPHFQPLLLPFPAPSRSPSSGHRSCGPSSPPSPLSTQSLVSLLSRGLCALSPFVWWGPCCAFCVGPSPVYGVGAARGGGHIGIQDRRRPMRPASTRPSWEQRVAAKGLGTAPAPAAQHSQAPPLSPHLSALLPVGGNDSLDRQLQAHNSWAEQRAAKAMPLLPRPPPPSRPRHRLPHHPHLRLPRLCHPPLH